MTNEELVKDIQAGDMKAAETLYNQNKGLIWTAIKRFAGRAEAADLEQQAFIVMVDAVNDYEEREGASFATFFFQGLLWGFCRYLYHAENDKGLSPGALSLVMKYRRFENDFMQSVGRVPAKSETRFYLRLTDRQEKLLDAALCSKSIISLSTKLQGEDNDSPTMEDTIPDLHDVYDEIEDQIDNEKDAAEIRKAVAELPEIESRMIQERYFDDMTPSDMAKKNNLTPSRVDQIIKRGQQRLRDNRAICRIARNRGFSSGAYRGSLAAFEITGCSSVEMEVFRQFGLSAKG